MARLGRVSRIRLKVSEASGEDTSAHSVFGTRVPGRIRACTRSMSTIGRATEISGPSRLARGFGPIIPDNNFGFN